MALHVTAKKPSLVIPSTLSPTSSPQLPSETGQHWPFPAAFPFTEVILWIQIWGHCCLLGYGPYSRSHPSEIWFNKVIRISLPRIDKLQPLTVFISKIILKHSHAHSFMHCLWPLSCPKGRLEYLQQILCGPQSLKYFLYSPLEKISGLVHEFLHFERN